MSTEQQKNDKKILALQALSKLNPERLDQCLSLDILGFVKWLSTVATVSRLLKDIPVDERDQIATAMWNELIKIGFFTLFTATDAVQALQELNDRDGQDAVQFPAQDKVQQREAINRRRDRVINVDKKKLTYYLKGYKPENVGEQIQSQGVPRYLTPDDTAILPPYIDPEVLDQKEVNNLIKKDKKLPGRKL